jgi:hypothetical protein
MSSLRKDKNAKLRSIPVRLLFDDPDLSLRANYTMFDRASGRPLCVGNGETCQAGNPVWDAELCVPVTTGLSIGRRR